MAISQAQTQSKDLRYLLRLAPIYALYLVTFGFASFNKLIHLMDPPDWFKKMFSETLLGHPLVLHGSFLMITGMETLVVLSLLGSLYKREFLPNRPKLLLQFGLILSLFTFVILSFGLRLVSDNQGSSNLFFYFGATLIALLFVEKQ